MLEKMRKKLIDRTAKKPDGSWALKYYAHPKGHYHSFKIIMDALDLKADDKYCEIGGGGGALMNMAMSGAGSGAAIDHSQAMVALSLTKNREYIDQGRLEIVQGDAGALPWESERFTACASANMFFFVENPEIVLSEVFRVLAPGGRFSMVTAGKSLLTWATFGWLYHLNVYTDAAMAAMMQTAGFRKIRVNTGITRIQVCYGEK